MVVDLFRRKRLVLLAFLSLIAVSIDFGPTLGQEPNENAERDFVVQLAGHEKWGRFETPVLRVVIANNDRADARIDLDAESLRLEVGEDSFRLRQENSVTTTQVAKGQRDAEVFLVRLDYGQWQAESAPNNNSQDITSKLRPLVTGTHEITVTFQVRFAGEEQPAEVSASAELEMIEAQYFGGCTGQVLDTDGNPVAGAKIFGIGNGYMRIDIHNSGDGLSMGDLSPIYMRYRDGMGSGASGGTVNPSAVSDKEGRFEIPDLVDANKLLVVSSESSPFVYELSGTRAPANIQMPSVGGLKITMDIEGNELESDFTVSNDDDYDYIQSYARQFRQPPLTMSISSRDVKNGDSVELPILAAGRYRIMRSARLDLGDGRTKTVIISNESVEILPGQITEVNFVRKEGQFVSAKLTGAGQKDFSKVTVHFIPKSAGFPFKTYIENPEEAFAVDGMEFKSPMISPGEYNLIVRGYKTVSEDRGGREYKRAKEVFIGYEECSIGADNSTKEIQIEMLPTEEFYEAYGFQLPLQVVTGDGHSASGHFIHCLTEGFPKDGLPVDSRRTGPEGEISFILPFGVHDFWLEDDLSNWRSLFTIESPVMKQTKVVLPDAPKWLCDKTAAEKVQITASTEGDDAMQQVVVTVKNAMDTEIQLNESNFSVYCLLSMGMNRVQPWVLVLPPDHPIIGQTIKVGETKSFQLNWREMVKNGRWARTRGGMTMDEVQFELGNFYARARVGPAISPPTKVDSPFVLTQNDTDAGDK